MQNTLCLILFTLLSGSAMAQSNHTSPWILKLGIGHQQCSAEGGAVCGDGTDGLATELGVAYDFNRWVSAGVETSIGQFSGDDGYRTLTSFLTGEARYLFDKWGLSGMVGIGYMNASREENEPSVGSVEYSYTTFQALRFGGAALYLASERLSIVVRSHFTMGRTGEECVNVSGRSENCRENQDLIDMLSTTVGVGYRF